MLFRLSMLPVAFSLSLHLYAAAKPVPLQGNAEPRTMLSRGTGGAQASTGWYTPEQAANGARSYQKICASCHGAKLQGGAGGPALVGKQFWLRYGGKKISTLWSTVHTEMPVMAPGSVPPKTAINIMAFLLRENGVPSGTVPLDDTTDLSKVLPSLSELLPLKQTTDSQRTASGRATEEP